MKMIINKCDKVAKTKKTCGSCKLSKYECTREKEASLPEKAGENVEWVCLPKIYVSQENSEERNLEPLFKE